MSSTVIIMRGTSNSGKSSLLESAMFDSHDIISSDELRGVLFGDKSYQRSNDKVFAMVRGILKERLINKVDFTFMDSTNLGVSEINSTLEICERFGAEVFIISIEPPSLEELITRNKKRMVTLGSVDVPEHVLVKHRDRYYNCTPDLVKHIRGFKRVSFYEIRQENAEKEFFKLINLLISNKNEIVGNTNNIWAIGDVHGCAKEFRSLCEKIREKDQDAVIYQLGDLIDRGPDLLEVFRVVKDFNVRVVLGNHEMNFLQEVMGYKECRSRARQINIEKFNLYTEKQKTFILDILHKGSNFAVHYNGLNRIVLSHSVPVGFYSACRNSNGWTYSITSNKNSVEGIAKLAQTANNRNTTYIHGHMNWDYDDINKSLESGDRILNIDSGCCYGEMLTALCLNLKDVIQVKAEKNYNSEFRPLM